MTEALASAIFKLDARLSENHYITASGVSYLQPSVGTPWRPTTTARGNSTFRQQADSSRVLQMACRRMVTRDFFFVNP